MKWGESPWPGRLSAVPGEGTALGPCYLPSPQRVFRKCHCCIKLATSCAALLASGQGSSGVCSVVCPLCSETWGEPHRKAMLGARQGCVSGAVPICSLCGWCPLGQPWPVTVAVWGQPRRLIQRGGTPWAVRGPSQCTDPRQDQTPDGASSMFTPQKHFHGQQEGVQSPTDSPFCYQT